MMDAAPPVPYPPSHRMRAVLHPAGWTLRRRLVVSVVGLLAVTSIIIGTVGVLALQGFLLDRLDSQLTSTTGRSRQVVGEPDASVATPGFLTLPGQRPEMLGAVITSRGSVAGVLDASGAEHALSAEQISRLLTVHADGKPATVGLGGGLGDYRVAVNRIAADALLVTGLPMGEVQATLVRLVVVIALVTAAALALAAVGGTAIVRLALRPLDRVVQTASDVSALPLDRGEVALAVRVPERDADPSTEVGKVGAAINRMIDHVASALTARQASENKVRQFVADASHELRTPLASIRGYAELTRRGDYVLPDDVVHSIGRVESEAVRMTSLVEDLLLLARLDEGRDLQRAPVDLGPLLVNAVSDAHAAGGEHEWRLDVPDAPVVVSGDATRLHQVVMNLLANARIHTPAGTQVTVTLGTGEATAVIAVADNGPGIPDDIRAVLFERFARGERSRSRATGSTGLGLAIVRAVVASHGGTVSVTSVPGDTVFRVELPLAGGR
ncbi:HAMP domain-containing sensor histidine kinase [Parafrigoribacterium mesophilum]|uniref:sensor histidine kinase n=1 Tax=Parafrigoribacterium mesophilum TaxID=433646 RepID=UPI0031FC4D37